MYDIEYDIDMIKQDMQRKYNVETNNDIYYRLEDENGRSLKTMLWLYSKDPKTYNNYLKIVTEFIELYIKEQKQNEQI